MLRTGGRVTWMFTVSDAVLLSVGHVTVTVTGTLPSCCGAVHSVCRSAGCASVPVGAVHRYLTAHPIESCTVAVTVELFPTSTEHGLQSAFTVSVCCGAGAGGGGRSEERRVGRGGWTRGWAYRCG